MRSPNCCPCLHFMRVILNPGTRALGLVRHVSPFGNVTPEGYLSIDGLRIILPAEALEPLIGQLNRTMETGQLRCPDRSALPVRGHLMNREPVKCPGYPGAFLQLKGEEGSSLRSYTTCFGHRLLRSF